MNIKACLSSNTEHWATPKELYEKFMSGGHIDPCPFHAQFNGLMFDYNNAKIYVNPPFKDLSVWTDWIIKQANNNCIIWLLMPSRTDTKYFAKIFPYITDFYFLKGRLKYNDGKGVSPFPSMLLRIIREDYVYVPRVHNVSLEEFIRGIKI